jgi:hypothetical protein
MLDWNLFKKLIFPENPKFPNSREASYEELLQGTPGPRIV